MKVQLTHSGQKTKKKTEVKKQTTNPVFNESFTFDVSNDGKPGTGQLIRNGSKVPEL